VVVVAGDSTPSLWSAIAPDRRQKLSRQALPVDGGRALDLESAGGHAPRRSQSDGKPAVPASTGGFGW
jgi:hypothetical protein